MRYQEAMDPYEKSKLAWEIFERYSEQTPLCSNHVIGDDPLTWKNLQMLCGELEQQAIVCRSSRRSDFNRAWACEAVCVDCTTNR